MAHLHLHSSAQTNFTNEEKPLIVVCGATGLLGSAVIESLSGSKKFRVRGICKPEDIAASREMWCDCCEMIECDVDKAENAVPIFKGAVGAFIVTDTYDSFMHHHEKEVGLKLVNAAKEAGIRHLVFVSHPDVDAISQGMFKVPSFSQNAHVENAINLMQSVPYKRPFASVTIVRPGFYYQSFRKFFAPKKDGEKLVFTMPATGHPITAFNAEDIGPIVLKIFEQPFLYDRQRIDIGAEQLRPREFIDAIGKVSGLHVELQEISRKEYPQKVQDPWSEEMAQLFGFIDESGFFGPDANFVLAKVLCPNLSTFEEFLQTSDWAERHHRP